MEAAAQALCGDERPTDVGAVLATGKNIKDLADELGVPYGTVLLDSFVVTQHGGQTLKLSRQDYAGLVAFQIAQATGQTPDAVFASAAQAFVNVATTFPEITTSRLDGNDSDLALPMAAFAQKYGINLWSEALRPVLTGYGYWYFESVPAGNLLKLMYPAVASILGLPQGNLDVPIAFPCGFQSLPEMLAEQLDVRLNSAVTKISRKDDYISVKASNHPTM